MLSSGVDAGVVLGSTLPPQALYEMGGYAGLPSYSYKEFGGNQAALGSGLIIYQLPVLKTPRRVKFLVIPGLSPGIGGGVDAEGVKLERGGGKVPARSGQGHEDTGLAVADDVGSPVRVYVRKLTRVGIIAAPAAGIGTKGGELECRRCKRRWGQNLKAKQEWVNRRGNRTPVSIG